MAAVALFVCLSEARGNGDWLFMASIAVALLANSVAMGARQALSMSVEKDWIATIAEAEGGATLSSIFFAYLHRLHSARICIGRNAELTIIEHFSLVVAPMGAGYALTALSYRHACVAVAAINCALWALEHGLLARVYANIAALHSRDRGDSAQQGRASTGVVASTMSLQQQKRLLSGKRRSDRKFTSLHASAPRLSVRKSFDEHRAEVRHLYAAVRRPPALRRICAMLETYRRQEVLPAAIGLSLLYLSVLTFDGVSLLAAIGVSKLSYFLAGDCIRQIAGKISTRIVADDWHFLLAASA